MRTAFLLLIVFVIASVAVAEEPAPPPELSSLIRQYEQSITPITERMQSRIVNLEKEYFVALTQLHQDLLKESDLDGVLQVKKELERFEYKQELSEEQKRDMFPKLRTLRDNYEAGFRRIEAESEQQKRALAQQHLGNLQALEKKLLQKGNTNGANLVRDEKDTFLGARPDLSGEFTNGKISIRAYIDGLDTIKIQGNKLWYEHGSAALPGKWDGHNEPTFVNEEKWNPWWDGRTSRPYEKITPLRLQTGKRVYVAKKFGRGIVTLAEQPSKSNDQTLKLLIDDSAIDGADWYELQIKW